MKIITIYLDDNKIELYNSISGKETVLVNSEIVSSKRSICGGKHTFVILENGKEVECVLIIGFAFHGVTFNLYKAGKPIIESPNSVIPKTLIVILSTMFILMFIALMIFVSTVIK